MVIIDDSTCWNSTYNSIKGGLKLKNRVHRFCSHNRDDLRDDSLSENDWNYLAEIADGLRPLYEVSLVVEGNAAGVTMGLFRRFYLL
jgi:hypothetical protein